MPLLEGWNEYCILFPPLGLHWWERRGASLEWVLPSGSAHSERHLLNFQLGVAKRPGWFSVPEGQDQGFVCFWATVGNT